MSDMRAMLKRVMELVQPDLRKYYRVPRKGRIVAAYAASGGQWFADVQPLRNDESPDPDEPVLPRLELPVAWGGSNRGVVCPPVAGTYCTIAYWDGDPSYPYIAGIRWYAQGAPDCGLDEFIIQLEPGVSIKIDKAKHIVTLTPANVDTTAGKSWTVNVGQNARIVAGQSATVQAPQINIIGNQTSTGPGGGMGASQDKSHRAHQGSYTLDGPQTVNGTVTVNGALTVTGGINGKVNGCSGCGG